MLDAVRAEALKLRGHRATWFMVWVFPIGLGLIGLAQILQDLASAPTEALQAATAALWIEQGQGVWNVPLETVGRLLIAGFAALAFAGEYGWNTWKLIAPARARWQLIAAKWIVSCGFVFLALVAADLLGFLGGMLRPIFGGPQIPAGVTVAAVAEAHMAASARALVPILYTIAWAGLLAISTKSVLATVILSMVLVLLDQLLLPIGIFAHGYAPSLTPMLLQALPFYHLANLIAWAKGAGLTLPLGPGASLTAAWHTSLAIVLLWVGGIGAATLVRFARQDIN